MMVDDIVTRKSYGNDIFFRVVDKNHNNIYKLNGLDYRIRVTAPKDDLINIKKDTLLKFNAKFKENIQLKISNILAQRAKIYDKDKFSIKPGKVLHIDADREYLNICRKYYTKLEVPAIGIQIDETKQAIEVQDLLKKYMPDILIVTGHDSIKAGNDKAFIYNYKSSKYFIETVRAARLYNPCKDSLIIIAGACQSHYQGLIEAGANIASSPKRILIHALDHLFVAEKISYTSIKTILSINDIIINTITGCNGIGGYETRGTCRQGLYI